MIEMGCTCRDRVTQFTGIVVAKCSYITGCDQYCLQPPGLDDKGELIKARYFDETRLEVTKGVDRSLVQDVGAPVDNGGPEQGPEITHERRV